MIPLRAQLRLALEQLYRAELVVEQPRPGAIVVRVRNPNLVDVHRFYARHQALALLLVEHRLGRSFGHMSWARGAELVEGGL